jgi:hypothetical protein
LGRGCRALQVVDTGNRLAGATVRHDAGEALQAVMEANELIARSVVDDELGILHRLVFEMLRPVPQRRGDFSCAARISAVIAQLDRQSIALCERVDQPIFGTQVRKSGQADA